nr:MAG TPA: hypothetical protein [Caudoviricetes sp.]
MRGAGDPKKRSKRKSQGKRNTPYRGTLRRL